MERFSMPRIISYFLSSQKEKMWLDSNLESFDFESSILTSAVSLYSSLRNIRIKVRKLVNLELAPC